MMFWYGNSWAWWQAGLMWVAMIAFWGAVIWAAYAVITNLTRKPGTPDSSGDARSILDQRLARGEIGPSNTNGCAASSAPRRRTRHRAHATGHDHRGNRNGHRTGECRPGPCRRPAR